MEYIINSFLKTIRNEIRTGHSVKIEEFGTFSSYMKQEYMGKNLNNGKIEKIPSTRCISFRPSKKLKQ